MCLLFTWPCPSKHSRALLHIISLHNLSFPLGNILHFKTYLSLRSKRLHAGVRVKLEAEPDLWFGSQIPFFSLNFVQSRFKIKPLPLQSIAIACYWNPHCSIKDQNLRVCSRINVFSSSSAVTWHLTKTITKQKTQQVQILLVLQLSPFGNLARGHQ